MRLSFANSLLGGILVLILAAQATSAEPSAATIKRTKQATALVVAPGTGAAKTFGTAFCLDASGIFVTNHHVSKRAANRDGIQLVLDCGETNQRVLTAKELLVSEADDLAVLQVTDAKDLVALELGNSDELIDTMQVAALGFPFGDALSAQEGIYPSVSVNIGRITSLRKKAGELELVQVDVVLNPGNSGGPLIDSEGKVVAIVQAGLRGTGVNFAIPSKRLKTLLSKPVVKLEPATIDASKQFEPSEFRVRALMVPMPKTPYSLELAVKEGTQDWRTFTETASEDGSARFRFEPIPGGPKRTLQFMGRFDQGSVMGTISETEFMAGERTMKASEIRGITLGDAPQILLRAGQASKVALTGPKQLEVDLGGGAKISINPLLAKEITLGERPSPPVQLDYRVRVIAAGKVLGEVTGKLASTQPVPTPNPLANRTPPLRNPINSSSSVNSETQEPTITLPTTVGTPIPPITKETVLDSDTVTLKLPGAIDQIAAGGNGRYLLLHIKKLRKIAVFDVEKGTLGPYVSLPSDDVVYGASADKLVVLVRDQNLALRYDLRTLAKELTIALPDIGVIDGLAIGYASQGIGMVMTRNGPRFLDLTTLKMADNGPVRNSRWHPHPQYPYSIRVSADGSSYTGWSVGLSPSGIHLMQLQGNRIVDKHEHDSAGYLLPNFDGSMLYTGAGIFNSDLKPVAAENFRRVNCLTTYHPSYFLTFSGIGFSPGSDGQTKPKLSFYTTSDRALLFSTTDIAELVPANRDGGFYDQRSGLTIDKRIHYFPSAGLLVTIPDNREELVLRRLSLVEHLEKSGIDYLFVTSQPTTIAKVGELYSYPLSIQSKAGNLKYKLDSGPQGLSISSYGRLTWAVPLDAPEESHGVIVSIKDGAGQEVLHSFNLRVVKQ